VDVLVDLIERLELVARDLSRNVNRCYSIDRCVDLFGVHFAESF